VLDRLVGGFEVEIEEIADDPEDIMDIETSTSRP
jgi:hypothetical protein